MQHGSILFSTILAVILLASNSDGMAQCIPVGGSSGAVQTTSGNTLTFDVDYWFTSMLFTGYDFTDQCGFNFPAIPAPWSGNTDGVWSSITYNFSEPIYSIDLLIGYTGVDGYIEQESFTFITIPFGQDPDVSVNSGTCPAWQVNSNVSTSPAIMDALNSIHTISQDVAFTSLGIRTVSEGNGGSSYALCDGSASTNPVGIVDRYLIPGVRIFPNPIMDRFTIDAPINEFTPEYVQLYDVTGRLRWSMAITGNGQVLLPRRSLEPGLYVLEVYASDGRAARMKVNLE